MRVRFSSRGDLWPILRGEVRPSEPGLRHNMLGMTETGCVCLASDDEGDQPEHGRGSFGRHVPVLETRIVDPDSGADLAAGEVEIGRASCRGRVCQYV